MNIDNDHITHPLRLAKGSHQLGSGKGCAMNVISYINGDTQITDYPACSARPLARLVQILNDELAGPDGFLSPDNSVLVLDLGWQTIGTAEVSESVYALWIAEVLVNPAWGCVQYANALGDVAIRRIADLHRRAAAGDIPFAWSAKSAAWLAAESAAGSAAESAAKYVAKSAAWLAAESAAGSAAGSAAKYAAGYAAESAAESAAGYAALAEFTQQAITCWRELQNLDAVADIDAVAVDHALAHINKTS